MAKIKIIFNITIIYVFFLNYSFSQIVKNSNLDLLSNSTISDIKYNDKLSKYFVVGDFTSFGGSNRINLAVLNDSLILTSDIIIQSIDGEIKSIETDSLHIYIGGDFSTINGSTRNGLAIFDINLDGTISLNDVNVIQVLNGIVSDIELTDSNQVIILGNFDFVENGIQHKNIVIIDKNTLAYSNAIFSGIQIDSFNPSTLKIFKTSNMYVVTGDHVKKGNNIESSGIKFTHTGEYIDVIAVPDDNHKIGRELIQVKDNLFSYSRKPSQTNEIVLTDLNSSTMFTRSPDPNSSPSSCYGNQLPDKNQEIYNQEIFYIQDYNTSTTVIERYGVEISDSVNNIVDFSSKWCTPITNEQVGNSDTRKLIVANNKLFYHDKRLKKVETSPTENKGLVAFCLEPLTPVSFSKKKSDPCEKVKFDYKIDKVKNADGYEWKYTGTGAKIKLASDAAEISPQRLNSDTVFFSKNANEVQFEFEPGFTDGEMKVRAFTICNNFSERIYSKEIKIDIHNNTSSLIFTTSQNEFYNCLKDSVILTANTNVPNPEYIWKLQVPTSLPKEGQTVKMYLNEYDTTVYNYALEIRYTSLNQTPCIHHDTVRVVYNNQTPVLQLPSNFFTFDCSNTSLLLNGTSNMSSNYLYWNINGSNIANPAIIDSSTVSPGTYYFVGRNNTSFCKDSIPFTIVSDYATPVKGLINGTTFSEISPFGEITCANDSLSLIATNNFGQNNTYYWLDENQNQLDSVTLTFGHVRDTLHVVGENGCESKFVVFVNLNNTLPQVFQMGDVVMNCSVDTFTLVHDTHPTSLVAENGWLNLNGNDSMVVYALGEYIYEFVNPLNGCVDYDTVNVVKSNEIMISFDKPNYSCKDEAFTVSATAIGIENPIYFWNTGESTNNIIGIGGLDSVFVVQVTGENDCFGTASVEIKTAPIIQNQIEMFLSCDEEFIFMNNVVVSGGIAPFTYSIDGLIYQENNTIEGLLPGDYFVYIQDASTCIYSYPVTINEGVEAPDLHFLASTYNKPTDLVALVNTSSFGGFDTVYWQLPSSIIFEYETDSIRFISASDTGYFDITLVGTIDTCVYNFTKQVYFGSIDSVNFNMDVEKGIQNLNLYPNPNTGVFSVEVTFGVEQHYAMYISDIAGNIIANSMQSFGINHVENFDISSYPPGTYILRIISDFDVAYFPFVKN
jgi:hypothetical protein